jgi:hypothetical protein
MYYNLYTFRIRSNGFRHLAPREARGFGRERIDAENDVENVYVQC